MLRHTPGLWPLLVLVLGCPAETPDSGSHTKRAAPPDWTSAFAHEAAWDAGREALVVTVRLAPGFHAYTTGEETGRPLRIELDPESPRVLDGSPEYPKGAERQLPVGRSVIVEGTARIVAPTRPRAEGSAADRVEGRLHYQVCTDEACDRPRTARIALATATATVTAP